MEEDADDGHTSSLLNALDAASGQERRALLEKLRAQLSSQEGQKLLLSGLRHGSSDVQRAGLDALPGHLDFVDQNRTSVRSAVLSIIRRALGSASPESLASLSACRTLAAALSGLSLTVGDKISPVELQSIVKILLRCMSCGLAGLVLSHTSIQAKRISSQPGNAFSFAAPSALRSSTPTFRRQASSSSLRSVASSSWDNESVVSAAASDVDAEGGDAAKKAGAERAVRQKSIACIEALAKGRCPGVVVYFPQLLCETEPAGACLLDIVEHDEFSSNRIAACQACEKLFQLGATMGSFTGAEERTRISAFTSLSSRIAAMIVQSRHRLLSLMRPGGPLNENVKEAILRCIAVLVTSTHSARLSQSHMQVLQPIALQYCSSTQPNLAYRAYSLLTALSATNGERLSDTPMFSDNIVQTLRDPTTSDSVKVEAWAALALQSDCDRRVIDLALERVKAKEDGDNIRQAIADFCRKQLSFDQQPTALKELVNLLRIDSSAAIRAIAADCLEKVDAEGEALIELTADQDGSVRASAIRALGVAVQRLHKPIALEQIKSALRDPSFLVRSRASWSLGNVCEVTSDLELARECLRLREEDERICVHVIRGLGAVLAASTIADDRMDDVVRSLQWIKDVLQSSKDPKLRWNACSSLGRIFSSKNARVAQRLDKEHSLHIVTQLAHILQNDKMFKTRLSACAAIQAALENTKDELGENDMAVVGEAVRVADSAIEVQLESASFRERQLHVTPLHDAIKTLRSLMESNAGGIVQ